MSLDSRVINPEKVVELVNSKINTDYFFCKIYSYNKESLLYDFIVSAKYFEYDFRYNYYPTEMKIKDMNKLLKRKDNGNGITTDQLIANDIYQKFMSEWIGMAKPNRNSKGE